MAQPIFKKLEGNNPTLFPENIYDRIADNHPVRLVNEVVNQLDISSLLKQYKGGGTSSFHPRMMLKILFYSYLSNIYSCRKIAKALHENIHFMWLSGNSTPDYRTINYFRGKRLKGEIHHLFSEVVKLLQQMGYVSLDVQYTDGTKIESASNRYTFVWRGSVEKYKTKIEQKIQSVIEDIESKIKEENQTLNEEQLPKQIDSALLKEKLGTLNKRLKQSKKTNKAEEKQLKKLQEEHLPRLEKYERQLKTMGNRNSFSKTDTDATFMRMKEDHMKNGQLKPAYNTQISTENQFITHYSVHQTPGDTTTLLPHLESFENQYKQQSKILVADAGYGSEENYEWLESKGIEAYVKYNYFHKEQKRKMKNDPFLQQNLYYNAEDDYYVCPMGQHLERVGQGTRISKAGYTSTITYYEAKRCIGCPLRGLCHKAKGNRRLQVNHRLKELKEKAKNLLMSKKGLEHRSKRPIEPEAVFGQLKSNNKFNRFTLRSLDKVNVEFALMALGHNLRKMAAKALAENNFKRFTYLLEQHSQLRLILLKFNITIPKLTLQKFYIEIFA